MMKHHFEKIISKNFLEIGSFSKSKYIAVRKGKTQSEREVLQMQEEMKKIENCLECSQCIKKCPYELNTPELLKKNYEDYKKVLAGEVSVN